MEVLVFLDGAPTLFQREQSREYTKKTIKDGSLRDNIMEAVADMSRSGSLDDTEEIHQQFADYFSHGNQGLKWVARFCQAYVAHILLGVRASMEVDQLRRDGTFQSFVWPAQRTVLMKAHDGVRTQIYAQDASDTFDLDLWTEDIEVYGFPGTHFEFLSPNSGLGEALNCILCK